jgi:hypothetical protein
MCEFLCKICGLHVKEGANNSLVENLLFTINILHIFIGIPWPKILRVRAFGVPNPLVIFYDIHGKRKRCYFILLSPTPYEILVRCPFLCVDGSK